MTKSECDDVECTATPSRAKMKERAVENKKGQEANAQVSVRSVSRREPDGQSDDKDENDEGCEGNETAPRPLLLGLAHVSDKFSALFSGFSGFPICRRTKGNAENHRSNDPKNWEHCCRARQLLWRRC